MAGRIPTSADRHLMSQSAIGNRQNKINMAGYQQLKVWSLSHELTLDMYKLTEVFPKSEIFAMVSQIRRAAYSIPSNIVEGKSRDTD